MEEVENDREEGGVVDEGVVDVLVPAPNAPSRVNIWTCILHLINSIGVLPVSLVHMRMYHSTIEYTHGSLVRQNQGGR